MRKRVPVILLYLVIAAGLMPVAETARATDQPTAGMFLVATPDLRNSSFSETVILLVQHDEHGSMGLVINRPSDVDIATMWPDISDLDRIGGSLYLGGPVATYGVMLLIQARQAPADAEHVFGNVYASGSQEFLLEMISAGVDSSTIRLYAGHSGWSPGQLDYEIARGSWRVIPASQSMIFSDEPNKIWRKLAPLAQPMIVMTY